MNHIGGIVEPSPCSSSGRCARNKKNIHKRNVRMTCKSLFLSCSVCLKMGWFSYCSQKKFNNSRLIIKTTYQMRHELATIIIRKNTMIKHKPQKKEKACHAILVIKCQVQCHRKKSTIFLKEVCQFCKLFRLNNIVQNPHITDFTYLTNCPEDISQKEGPIIPYSLIHS